MYPNEFKLHVLEPERSHTIKITWHPAQEEHEYDGIATSEFGEIRIQVIDLPAFNISHTRYFIKKHVRFTFSASNALTALGMVLKNKIDYKLRGLPEGIFLPQSYNLCYAPALQGMVRFPKAGEYETFHIFFNYRLLEQWKNTFPVLQDFLQKLNKREPALLSALPLPASVNMIRMVADVLYCPFTGKIKAWQLEVKAKMLIKIALQLSGPVTHQPVTDLHPDDIAHIQEVRKYLLQNLDQPGTLTQLAHQFGLNDFKLKKGFKQLYKTPVFAFVREERLQRARKRLEKTSLPLREIAEEAGYQDLSNFSIAFKKRFGYPPSKLKKILHS